jgi:hypothetical protein
LTIIAREPIALPIAKDPVSPIKTFAGGALNQRKPNAEPISVPQKIDNSPLFLIYEICK